MWQLARMQSAAAAAVVATLPAAPFRTVSERERERETSELQYNESPAPLLRSLLYGVY